MKEKVTIEFDEPYEEPFLIVAEFAFRAAEKGWNWERTRAEVLDRISKVVAYKPVDSALGTDKS